MDHIVIPLDDDHERAATSIVAALSAAVDAAIHPVLRRPHITLVTYQGIAHRTAHNAVKAAVTNVSSLVVRAHGYGFFCGDDGHDLSLHVPVVRASALDALHELIHGALRSTGAEVAGWTDPSCWSPHITLVEGGLDPDSLGAGAGWLAQRHHPSWRIPVNRLSIVTGARFGEQPASTIELSVPASLAAAEPGARAQAC